MDLWEAGIWRPKMPALTPQPVVPAGNKKKEKNDKRKIKKMRSGGSWDVGILRPNIPREMGCLRFRHSLMSPQAYIYMYTHTHTHTYIHRQRLRPRCPGQYFTQPLRPLLHGYSGGYHITGSRLQFRRTAFRAAGLFFFLGNHTRSRHVFFWGGHPFA